MERGKNRKQRGSPAQLEFLFGQSESSLKVLLEEQLRRRISLVLTNNGSTMLSAGTRGDLLKVRLHRVFLNADQAVIGEILSFLKNQKGPMPHFRRFVRENRDRLQKKQPNKVPITTMGANHDLRELYRSLNEQYFQGAVAAAITWGTGCRRSSLGKRTLGSYSERSNTIRINPMLDRKSVPRYYLAYIVYHEMLHAALGVSKKGERRSIHSREFRRREKEFNDYERAIAWEKGRTSPSC